MAEKKRQNSIKDNVIINEDIASKEVIEDLKLRFNIISQDEKEEEYIRL